MSDDSRPNTFAMHTKDFVLRANIPARDLLPVIPIDGKVAEKSNATGGKTPGRYDFKNKQWWGLTGTWGIEGLSQKDISSFAAFPTENVGLRAADFPCVDIDTASQEACDMVVALAETRLGYAPTRLREGAPRALLVYIRCVDEPIRKLRFKFKSSDGLEHAVEILGLGQQYLINGFHPSGTRYEWAQEADLMSWGAAKLSPISAQDTREFIDLLRAEVLTRKWEILEDVRRSGSTRAGIPVEDLDPIIAVPIALSALKAIPNTQDIFADRNDLISVLASFKAAVGREANDPSVYEAVRQWASEGYPDEDWIRAPWVSLKTVRVGPERLFGLAHQFGWVGDAREEFKDSEGATMAIKEAKTEQDELDAAISALAKKVVYWPNANRWIEKDTREQLKVTAFNSSPRLGVQLAKSGANGMKTASNILLNSGAVQCVNGMTYLPGAEQLVKTNLHGKEDLYFNTWQAQDIPKYDVSDADVAPWLDHAKYLFEEEKDREYLLDFLAHVVQKRGVKIRWAPVIVGAQGVGKDILLKPIVKGLGEFGNTKTIQPERLTSNFNEFFETELAIVQEIQRSERTDVYERLKALISGTANDIISIERKYEKPYDIKLTVNMIWFTNHSDALALSADDRRFFVISSEARPRGAEYYDALSSFYNKKGWEKVFNWLRKRDISQFNPDAKPLWNEAKASMIEESQPYYALWLRDHYLKTRGIVKVGNILEDLATNFNYPQRVRDQVKGQSQIVRALRFAGWFNKQVRVKKERHQFWFKHKETMELSSDEIHARFSADLDRKLVYANA